MHSADHTANVVANFVAHRGFRLAAHTVAIFALHHHDCRFNVRPLVVVGEELITLEAEEVEPLFKHAADVARRVGLERDERRCADSGNRIVALATRVMLPDGRQA